MEYDSLMESRDQLVEPTLKPLRFNAGSKARSRNAADLLQSQSLEQLKQKPRYRAIPTLDAPAVHAHEPAASLLTEPAKSHQHVSLFQRKPQTTSKDLRIVVDSLEEMKNPSRKHTSRPSRHKLLNDNKQTHRSQQKQQSRDSSARARADVKSKGGKKQSQYDCMSILNNTVQIMHDFIDLESELKFSELVTNNQMERALK